MLDQLFFRVLFGTTAGEVRKKAQAVDGVRAGKVLESGAFGLQMADVLLVSKYLLVTLFSALIYGLVTFMLEQNFI